MPAGTKPFRRFGIEEEEISDIGEGGDRREIGGARNREGLDQLHAETGFEGSGAFGCFATMELKEIRANSGERARDHFVIGIGDKRDELHPPTQMVGEGTGRFEGEMARGFGMEDQPNHIGTRAHRRIGRVAGVNAAYFHQKRHKAPLIAVRAAEIKRGGGLLLNN